MGRCLGYAKALLRAGIPPNAAWQVENRGEDGKLVPLVLPAERPEAFVRNRYLNRD